MKKSRREEKDNNFLAVVTKIKQEILELKKKETALLSDFNPCKENVVEGTRTQSEIK